MTLRRRTLLIIGLTICALTASLQMLFSRILMEGFLATEALTTRTHVTRAYGLFENLSEGMNSKISDWARWDDAYEFMQSRKKNFIKSNLTTDTATGLRLNHFLFFDSKAQPVLTRSYDLEESSEVATPPSLLAFFQAHTDQLSFSKGITSRRGLIPTPEGLILAVMQPIVQSNGDGPPRGTLVFAKKISKDEQQSLSHLLQLPVEFYDLHSDKTPRNIRALVAEFRDKDAILDPLSAELIDGYGLVKDLLGAPALIFRLEGPREVYRQARVTHRSMLGALLISALVFTLVMVATLEQSVIHRVRLLGWQVKKIAKSGDSAARIEMAGADEITGLAGDINHMLATLESFRRELVQATMVAESASRMKSSFVANVSHELRTPLNGILGVTQMLERMPLVPEVRSFVSMITESGQALLTVINDILDFSKIEAGKLSLDPIPTDLPKLVSGALSSLALRAFQKGIELVCDIDPTVPTMVNIDGLRIRQVLLNLTGNAIKFTEKGQIVIKVSAEACGDEETRLTFAVSDTGIGIPKEKHDAIFAAFSQEDASTTRKYGGTGLGLTISRSLAELMGGKLSLESECGRGSTFSFSLQAKVLPASSEHTWQLDERLAAIPMLVTEKNDTVANSVTRALSSVGFTQVRRVELDENLQLVTGSDRAVMIVASNALATAPDGVHRLAEVVKQRDGARWVGLLPPHELTQVAELRQRGMICYTKKPVSNRELQHAILVALGVAKPESDEAAASSSESFIAKRALRVFVVDDVKTNQTVLRLMLESWGHQVEVASSGREVIELLTKQNYFEPGHTRSEQDFDIVLMDMQMPDLDGVETTERIRLQEQQSEGDRYCVPILAVTANVLAHDIERCTKAGMSGAVTKPIEATRLFKSIEILTGEVPLPPSGARKLGTLSSSSAPQTVTSQAVLASLRTRLDNCGNRETKIIDLDFLCKEFGEDEEILAEILGAFLEETPQLLDALKHALREQGAQEIARAAHALKGSLGNAGAWKTRAIAAELETRARSGEVPQCASLAASLLEQTESARALLQRAMAQTGTTEGRT